MCIRDNHGTSMSEGVRAYKNDLFKKIPWTYSLLFPKDFLPLVDGSFATTRKTIITDAAEPEIWPTRLFKSFTTETYLQCSMYCGFEFQGAINCHFIAFSNVSKQCCLGNINQESDINLDAPITSYSIHIQYCKSKFLRCRPKKAWVQTMNLYFRFHFCTSKTHGDILCSQYKLCSIIIQEIRSHIWRVRTELGMCRKLFIRTKVPLLSSCGDLLLFWGLDFKQLFSGLGSSSAIHSKTHLLYERWWY